MKIRKLTIVLYCNSNFNDIEKTLKTIEIQNINKHYYDVVILNDNANNTNTKEINEYIKTNNHLNYYVVSFDGHTGMPISIDFAFKNKLINSDYVTIIKSGDTFENDWLKTFIEKLFVLNYDMYMTNVLDYMIYEKIKKDKKTGKEIKTTYLRKSRHWPIDGTTSEVDKEDVVQSKPVFLGKIWKTSVFEQINALPDKILYQNIFLYYQLVLYSNTFYYWNKFTSKMIHNDWIPREMDDKRIELLCDTINRMVSKNPYLNGMLLELLANAINRTPRKHQKHYIIKKHEYLNNFTLGSKNYNLSKRKIKKLTASIIKLGLIQEDKKSKFK